MCVSDGARHRTLVYLVWESKAVPRSPHCVSGREILKVFVLQTCSASPHSGDLSDFIRRTTAFFSPLEKNSDFARLTWF